MLLPQDTSQTTDRLIALIGGMWLMTYATLLFGFGLFGACLLLFVACFVP
jgi:hypothetical protein